MKGRDRVVVPGVLAVLLLGWLGFLFHHSPRFPGSGLGAVFGIAGAVLMMVPLAYPIVKRVPFFHDRITPHISMQTLLLVHVYAGILGPLLAIIHTGHKFDSPLGITLTAVMLLVVVSGSRVGISSPTPPTRSQTSCCCSRPREAISIVPGACSSVPRARGEASRSRRFWRRAWRRSVSTSHTAEPLPLTSPARRSRWPTWSSRFARTSSSSAGRRAGSSFISFYR